MKILYVLVLVLIIGPVFAQEAVQAPITIEAAEGIANAKYPGVVEDAEEKGQGLYEFEIEQEDGAVVEVIVDAQTGEITREKINYFRTEQKVPDPKIKRGEAKDIARDYIRKQLGGSNNVKVTGSEYSLIDGVWAYEIGLRLVKAEYEVVVDAMTGAVISAGEDDVDDPD